MPSFKLQLPATSANLGPGFDAVGLAMRLFLTVEAEQSDAFHLSATGRNADLVGAVERNLMLETYRSLAPKGPPLALTIHNEIPLGMGCGSSAGALVAGVQLANHFGELRLSAQEVLEEACAREGHPDNVAACLLGGLTVSAAEGRRITAASLGQGVNWKLVLVLPKASLATSEARAVLPGEYSRAEAVSNLQSLALLVAAFAQGRPELLRLATRDRLHQPFRNGICRLLPQLLPLAGTGAIFSVTLSGAGPSVLLIADALCNEEELRQTIQMRAEEEVEAVFTSVFHLSVPKRESTSYSSY